MHDVRSLCLTITFEQDGSLAVATHTSLLHSVALHADPDARRATQGSTPLSTNQQQSTAACRCRATQCSRERTGTSRPACRCSTLCSGVFERVGCLLSRLSVVHPSASEAMSTRNRHGTPYPFVCFCDPAQVSAECVDLLSGLLQPDPARRIPMAALTQHPWFLASLPPQESAGLGMLLNRPAFTCSCMLRATLSNPAFVATLPPHSSIDRQPMRFVWCFMGAVLNGERHCSAPVPGQPAAAGERRFNPHCINTTAPFMR